jgi:hypothetical protein
MKGTRCLQCKKGEYQETKIFDAWDGVLHCNNCGHEIKIHETERPTKEGEGGDDRSSQ